MCMRVFVYPLFIHEQDLLLDYGGYKVYLCPLFQKCMIRNVIKVNGVVVILQCNLTCLCECVFVTAMMGIKFYWSDHISKVHCLCACAYVCVCVCVCVCICVSTRSCLCSDVFRVCAEGRVL